MILLIPTNDGINISPDFDKASSFRLLKVINGYIKDDQLKDTSEKSVKGLRLIQDIIFKKSASDKTNNVDPELRQIVITREISKESETSLQDYNYKIFHSHEINIINAINKYLKDFVTHESDYICSP